MTDTPQTVTLTAAQFAVLERAQKLVDAQWKDPKNGAAFRAKAKELFNDISLPEDQVDPVVAPLREKLESLETANKTLLERIEKRDKDEADKAAQTSLETALENARKKYSLTDEGFDKMVSRMKETSNYTDAEAAAAWVASNMPAPKTANGPSWQPQNLDFYGSKVQNDDFALLHKDPEAFFDQTVSQILTEAAA
jgi:hypothetical protein